MIEKYPSVFGDLLKPEDIPELFELIQVMQIHTGSEVVAIKSMPGGLTNKNFVVEMEDGTKAALRVAGFGTSEYIDRSAEKHNLSLIGSQGIAPEIYYFHTKTGGMLSEFVEFDTMHPDDFIKNKTVLKKAAEVMAKVHRSGAKFKGRFDPNEAIQGYLKILEQNHFTEQYDGMAEALKKLDLINAAYVKNPPELVPCHNDTLAENFMFDGNTMRVIDWEYSGMNDGFYDIACIIVENPLDAENEKILLEAYLGEKPNEVQLARTLINKFLVTLHWSIWSLVQICSGKDYDFYWEYGRYRSDFYTGYMADPDFDRYIELLGK